MDPKRLTLPLLTLAIAGATVLQLRSDGNPSSPAETPEARITAVPGSSPRSALKAGFGAIREVVFGGSYSAPPGRELTFDVDAAASVEMRLRIGDAPANASQRIAGRMVLTVLDRRDEELLVHARFEDVRGEVRTGEQVQSMDGIAGEMARGATLRMEQTGRLLGYRFPKGSSSSRRQMRTLLSALHFVVPEAAAATWEVDDVDTYGPHRSRYEVLERSGRRVELRRTRVAYQPVDDDAPNCVAEGSTKGVLDATAGWMRSVTGSETTNVSMPEQSAEIVGVQSVTITLTNVRDGVAFDVEPDWDCPGSVDGAGDVDEVDDRADAKTGIEVHGLLADLVRALAKVEQLRANEARAFYTAVSDLVRTDPGALAVLAEFVRDGAQDPRAVQIVMAGLAVADTEAAHGMFADVLASETYSERVRTDAATTTLGIAKPPRRVLEGLGSAFRSAGSPQLRDTSLLMLGAGLGKVGATDELLALEAEARRKGALLAWLGALGNAGTPDILPALERALASQTALERRAATNALRKLRMPRAGELLRALATGDSDLSVRHAATRWLTSHHDALSLNVLASLAADADAERRMLIVDEFGRQLADAPALRPLLEAIAQHNSNPDVRARAAQMLQ